MLKRRGFTLIELLVVISIITLLIALLLPALGQARFTAETTLCVSRIRHMGLGVRMYADENKNQFPPVRSPAPLWFGAPIGAYDYALGGSGASRVAQYLGYTDVNPYTTDLRSEKYPLVHCPSKATGTQVPAYTNGYGYYAFAMLWSLQKDGSGYPNPTTGKLDRLRHPAKVGAFIDSGCHPTALQAHHVDTYGLVGDIAGVTVLASPNHLGRGLSTVFIDGHALWHRPYSKHVPTIRPPDADAQAGLVPPWWNKSFWGFHYSAPGLETWGHDVAAFDGYQYWDQL